MASKTVKSKKEVRDIVREELKSAAETKFNDLDVGLSNIPPGGANFILASIADGTSNEERVGQKIRAFQLEIRGTLQMLDALNQVIPQNVRMILWRDMNQRGGGAIPTITDVLESGATQVTNQQYAWDEKQRFQILADRRFVMDPQHENRMRNFYIKVNRPMIIHYDGTGAGSYSKGAIYLGFVSDALLAVDFPEVFLSSRLLFHDM